MNIIILLDQIKHRDAVAHGTQQGITIGRENDIALCVHSAAQMAKLQRAIQYIIITLIIEVVKPWGARA
jgi:hypothetical protein